MIRIAICDDEKNMLDMIYSEVLNTCTNNDIEGMIDMFLDPRDFKKKCRITAYDLVFLDINMTPITGLELAEYLNIYFSNTNIVFVTSYSDIVYETFKYSPLAFIRKDFFTEDIRKNINLILRKLKLEESCIIISLNNIPYKVKISDICYIESSRNNIIIHMRDETELIIRKTFKSFLEEVNSDIIVQINRGLMINLSFIQKVEPREVILCNNQSLPISKVCFDYFKDKFFQYSGGYI